jgi:mycothiol synthase
MKDKSILETRDLTSEVPNAPAIDGLCFRRFRGAEDFPKILEVCNASLEADNADKTTTLADIASNYKHLVNCDPDRDMIFAEVNGQAVGYLRGFWWEEVEAGLQYAHIGFLLPGWRRQGIGTAMLTWMENRLRAVAAEHAAATPKYFRAGVFQSETGTAKLLERSGYQPIRYFYDMVRPSLADIPDHPLPEGLTIRAALPEHYRTIWETRAEISRDHWGYGEPMEEHYQAWLNHKSFFQPHLWQVAWDQATDRIAGLVLTFINHAENEKYQRQRGYTESIGVCRAWRQQGVASALIARSLQAQKAAGMTESALGVDSENLSGATRLYERCGFQVVKRHTIYRKPF